MHAWLFFNLLPSVLSLARSASQVFYSLGACNTCMAFFVLLLLTWRQSRFPSRAAQMSKESLSPRALPSFRYRYLFSLVMSDFSWAASPCSAAWKRASRTLLMVVGWELWAAQQAGICWMTNGEKVCESRSVRKKLLFSADNDGRGRKQQKKVKARKEKDNKN